MKPETRTWIGEYVAILPPGGILMRGLSGQRELPISKRRKLTATGLLILIEGLRMGSATMPLWLPLLVESNTPAENKKYEQLVEYAMAASTYICLSWMSRFFLNGARDYWRQQSAITSLYPPKVHPTYKQGQEQQRELGDLEKRL